MTVVDPQLLFDVPSPIWSESMREALQSRGFASVTAYAESLPQKALPDLAAAVDHPAVTWVRMERLLVEEAEASGSIDRCARSLLARDLRDKLPDGWPREWTANTDDEINSPLFRRAGVFHALTMALPERCRAAVERIRRAMEAADIPAGWVPKDADDPLLVETFARYWLAPQT